MDTVICWDPWEHYEENPDHIATAHAVEAARWMAGMRTDYPEQLDAGLTPHSPGKCIITPGLLKGLTELLISQIILIKKLNPI